MELREKIARLWWDTDYWPKTIGFRTDETTFENSIDQVKDECYFFADQIIALFQSHYLELAKGKGLKLTDEEQDKCSPSTLELLAYMNTPDDETAAYVRANFPDQFPMIAKQILWGQKIADAQLVKVMAYNEAEDERVRKEERERILLYIENNFDIYPYDKFKELYGTKPDGK